MFKIIHKNQYTNATNLDNQLQQFLVLIEVSQQPDLMHSETCFLYCSIELCCFQPSVEPWRSNCITLDWHPYSKVKEMFYYLTQGTIHIINVLLYRTELISTICWTLEKYLYHTGLTFVQGIIYLINDICPHMHWMHTDNDMAVSKSSLGKKAI